MKILHLLAQKPGFTGSGVYLQSIVRLADAEGHQQAVLCGIPAGEKVVFDAGYQPQLYPVWFESGDLPFPVVGMSNVMPYKSTRYDKLTPRQLIKWETAFNQQITKAVEEFQPDIILSHHLWLLSALARQIAPDTPLYLINHGTALRQAKFCPRLAAQILPHLQKAELVFALNKTQKAKLIDEFQLDPEKIIITGNGYNETVFYPEKRQSNKVKKLVYASKISYAKGTKELLATLQYCYLADDRFELTICGSGAGSELYKLKEIAEKCSYPLEFTGNITQQELADIFRSSNIFILPSYYEGLPLVLIEALACGLQVIVNDLPGVKEWLGKDICESGMIDFVTLPDLDTTYIPMMYDIPDYIERLALSIKKCLKARKKPVSLEEEIKKYSWSAVFDRIKQYW
ncbi:MAG: glycosyltransferase family 4 protein [Candidatus Cloacimonetes bacterium]|nr:glycosyltransferase family 4 protein [Candidatus Cloacimonadota bacterium]